MKSRNRPQSQPNRRSSKTPQVSLRCASLTSIETFFCKKHIADDKSDDHSSTSSSTTLLHPIWKSKTVTSKKPTIRQWQPVKATIITTKPKDSPTAPLRHQCRTPKQSLQLLHSRSPTLMAFGFKNRAGSHRKITRTHANQASQKMDFSGSLVSSVP